MRYNDESESHSIWIGLEYRYTHSTVALFHGTVLGGARVYLLATINGRDKLIRGRMKQTLRNLGYSILSYQFDTQNSMLARIILAPLVNTKVIIIETLVLRNIERILLSRYQSDSPKSYIFYSPRSASSAIKSNLSAFLQKRHKYGVYV